MFDFIQNDDHGQAAALDSLRAFAADHREALLNASALLGAKPGIRLAQSAIDGLFATDLPTRSTTRALDDLLNLLMLEHVHEPDRIESGRFAMIDPASPVVEEICLLADGLDDRLEAYCQATAKTMTANTQKVAA